MLIAPDAYKGSLDAMAAARAIAAGWRRQRPDDQLDLCPMADGGDGFGPVLAQWLDAEPRLCDTVDAAGRRRQARWWWAPRPLVRSPSGPPPLAAASLPVAAAPAPFEAAPAISLPAIQPGVQACPPAVPGAPPQVRAPAFAAQALVQPALALVESAEVIGLALLPPALRHPLPMDGVAPDAVHQPPPAPGDRNRSGPDSRGLDSGGLESRGLDSPDLHSNGLNSRGVDSSGSNSSGSNSSGSNSSGPDSPGLDSRGLAPLLLAAAQAGAERLLIGLGGSASNDGGFGLARALGWRFFDGDGAAIRRWGDLERLERVEPPPQPPLLPQLVIAVDVRNPLLGPEGATAIYGPQKGLTPQQLPRAEACLRRLAECLEARAPGVAERPGSGAAGGLGYGLQVFCGGRLRAGAELVAELCGLEPRLRAADLVIAGEGRFDRQSLMGKGTGRLLRRAQRAGRPSLLLVGQLDGAALQRAQADAAAQGCAVAARALVPDLTDLSQACADPALWLERLAQRAAADLDALNLAAAP